MHEFSIATQIIDVVLAAAAQHDVARVQKVVLEVGAMRLVSPDAMDLAFGAVAEGTIAEGAELEIVELPIRARCRPCGRQYEAQFDNYRCPDCGQADVDVVGGNDILLRSVVCETPDEGAQSG